jgi:ATP-binding cassette, subfamily B, bacterial
MFKNLHFVKAKLQSGLAQLPYLPAALSLVWASSKGLGAAWAAILAAQGLLPIATVYLVRSLVNLLVVAVRSRGVWQDLRPALAVAAVLALVMLLAEVLSGISRWLRSAQSQRVQDHITNLIHEKSRVVDLAFYETPEFFDHLHRARSEGRHRPIALLESLGSLFQNGVTLAGMAVVLLPYGAWMPAALLASTLPALVVVVRATAQQHAWSLRTTADERRTWYWDWLLMSGEAAAELRLFGIGGHLQRGYQALRRRLRNEHLGLEKSRILSELAAACVAVVITGCALAWMVWRTLRGSVTLGDLALFYQAFQQGQLLLRSALQNTGQIYANLLFLGSLFEFLALQPRVVDPARPSPAPNSLQCGIRFDRVTFRYPGSENCALRDFSLFLPAGRIAAIVGPNGAGKSTLIKLLCRLYDPDEGRIMLDATDIREFSTEDLRRRIGVLFQIPIHFSATVRENIEYGDPASDRASAGIEAAARAAGAEEFIARLPNRYENMLGTWFEGGAELSVGEWQRIALARAFLRPAPILILDEPTSAMDPWAEADWLGRFRRFAQGRTALIITHRLTTAMCADIILVAAEGRIVESGTHRELLSRGGRYAESWGAQMEASV